MSAPKKRRAITLQTKKEVIAASEGKSLGELSKLFDLPRPSIQNIMRNKEEVIKAINEGSQTKRARLKKAKYEDLEEVIWRWCEMVRSQNAQLSGPVIAEKALQLAVHLNIKEFKASDSWLAKFKHRHSINFVVDGRKRRLAVDEQAPNGKAQNLAEIAEDVLEADMEVADKQSVANMVEKEKEEELPSFTPREAKDALTILQCYVRQNISNPNVLRSCDNIDKALVKERLKKMEQQ